MPIHLTNDSMTDIKLKAMNYPHFDVGKTYLQIDSTPCFAYTLIKAVNRELLDGYHYYTYTTDIFPTIGRPILDKTFSEESLADRIVALNSDILNYPKGYTNKRSSYLLQIHYGSVYFEGDLLTPERSWEVANHSPDGFNWGYSGSGPTQLALAICLEIYGTIDHVNYQLFRDKYIASMPNRTKFESIFTFNKKHFLI